MRILEEFWYGNIELSEHDTSPCKEYKKALQLINRNEEELQATMTDAQKELFSRYAGSVREFQEMLSADVGEGLVLYHRLHQFHSIQTSFRQQGCISLPGVECPYELIEL